MPLTALTWAAPPGTDWWGVLDAIRSALWAPLTTAVLLAAAAAMVLPALRGTGAGARRYTAVLLAPALAAAAVVAAELLIDGFRGLMAIGLLAAVVAAGAAALLAVRRGTSARLAAGRPAERSEQGAMLHSWFTAAALGFLGTVAAGIALLYFGADIAGEAAGMPSLQVAGVLAAVAAGGLVADLLPRFRTPVRRAELRPREVGTVLPRAAVPAVSALTALVVLGGGAVSVGEYYMTKVASCYPGRDLTLSYAGDTIGLGMIGVSGAAVAALGAAAVLAALRRPPIGLADPGPDRALRRLSAARTLFAVAGAELVLAADLVTGAAYAVLPVDPACRTGEAYAATGFLPGPHQPGALLYFVGLAVAAAGLLVWAVGTWRAGRAAAAALGAAEPPARPVPAEEAG
ncbi:hypothetical protein [Nocardiopsis composta]|uniref:Uncharacterized protein n=1 Tax=Nocardiopsis composta TaxID=157465 RepID=A0A7W8VFY5_9ACTN|nr:hypothetical protein [Nocardiopsis composta]MBB5434454.1 hypothetical protein [Nocardiopsis composta]